MLSTVIDLLRQFIDLVLHLDVHLAVLAQTLGPWMYVILFLVIFAETGLVVTPFLPGDSLLFATGALISMEATHLNIGLMWALLIIASFMGDNLNYSVGRWLGPQVFRRPKSLLMNPEYLLQAQKFYVEHGGKTVFLARFLPILRTFAPFVAGVGHMKRSTFMAYSASGSVVWISLFLWAGYAFGNIPWVKGNFTALIMGVIVLSVMPILITAIRSRFKKKTSQVSA